MKLINHKMKAAQYVEKCTFFHNPKIDFVLVKKEGDQVKYKIGVKDGVNQERNFLYLPYAKKKIIPSYALHYKNKEEKELFDECMEGFYLLSIKNGFVPVFVSIGMHISLWEFIETYLNEVNYMREAVLKYLAYCRSTGINPLLLTHLSESSIANLYCMFIKSEQDQKQIVIAHCIDSIMLTMYYEGELNQETVFTVESTRVESGEQIYHDCFGDPYHAYNDFMRLFYQVNIDYHERLINTLNQVLSDFSEYYHDRFMEGSK